MRRLFLLTSAMLLAAVSACSDAAAPKGRAGTVTVRAYVDRDASSSYTPADSALAGVAVSLSRDGTSAATATTDANGLATFSSVAPGSYQVSLAGDAPAGAALVTNPAPSAVVSFQGGSVAVDFRYVFFPGSISGRIYREDNGVAGFQAGADAPGGGLWVYLHLDSAGTAGRVVDSVQTDAAGAYAFGRVAPGSYFLTFEQPSTISYVGGAAPQHITVSAAQATAGDATSRTFTGSLSTPIATARTKPAGTQVAVYGNVTVAPNTFTSGTGGVNSEIWVQDSTGGIASFPVPSSSTFALGDRVQVVGVIGLNGGAVQIGTSANPPAVTAAGGNAVVAPKPITVLQARARTDEGQLVRVSNLTIASVPTGTTTSFTVIATSSAGDTLQIRVSNGTGITRAAFTVGNRYNVTGILSQFNGTAQLKPRGTADITLGQTITPIATLRAQPTGTAATVVGNVTVPPGKVVSGTGLVNSEVWIQDATGGIAVFPVPTADSATIHLGDVLEVSGTTSAFGGQLQIGAPTVTRLRAGTAPPPVVITGPVAAARTNEGQLVTLNNFTVTSVGTASGTTGAYTVVGTADGQSGIQLRVYQAVGASPNMGIPTSTFTVGNTYSVTGVLSEFNGTAQIKPRMRSDVTP